MVGSGMHDGHAQQDGLGGNVVGVDAKNDTICPTLLTKSMMMVNKLAPQAVNRLN